MRKKAGGRKAGTHAFWLIEGFDGLSPIYQRTVQASHISDENLQRLLQVLTAKAGLTPDEIVAAHTNRRAPGTNEFLRVSREGQTFTCGDSPFFVARYHRGGA